MGPDADVPFEPEAERTIGDVETLKAISDPVRIRILDTMLSRPEDAWTVKRLASALGVGPTKLYHHVNVLEERGLIRPSGTRVVSGIIETRYRVAQLSIRLDRRLLAGGRVPEAVDQLMRTVLDGVRNAIEESLRAGVAVADPEAPPAQRLILARGLTRLPPERAAELHERMRALIAEFDALDDAGDDAQPFGYLVGLYPMTVRAADAAGEEDPR
jgi:DNA-binding transcriptional ArsR family regulator